MKDITKIIANKSKRFKIISIKEIINQSPFEVSGINTNITTEELVETVKQSRARL